MARFAIILILFSSFAFGQTPKADSLLNVVKTQTNDSLRQEARVLYVQELRHNYAATSKEVFAGIEEAKKNHDFFFMGQFYAAAGIMYSYAGQNDSALIFFQSSLNYRVFIKDTIGIASSNLGISNTYRNMGDYKNAIKYGLDAEKASLQGDDPGGLARVYNALGLIFKQQGDFEKALDYYRKGIQQVEITKDEVMMSGFYSNIGTIFQGQKAYDSSRVYYRKALNLRKKNNDVLGLGISYGNFGLMFIDANNLDSALFYTNLALSTFEEMEYLYGIALCYSSLGNIWQKKEDHPKAIQAYQKAEACARQGNFLPDLINILKNIALSYEKLGKFKEATLSLNEHILLKDSLDAGEQAKDVQKLEIEYQYKQKQLADSLKLIEKEKLAAVETKRQIQINSEQQAKFRLYAFFGVAVIALIFIVLLLQYRSTQKQKKFNRIIALQKATVEEKNKEITDSINYAKRIQEAILPPAHFVEKHLPESFILYKPKDIVAGDFYWLDHSADQTLIAAADCTGHGVPGAMVSVVCSNALNRAVKEFGIKTPGKILDKVRELVIETFEKSEKDVKDGMDIALVSIKSVSTTGIKIVEYSGANNPLWLLRKDSEEFEELKADKQPIGNYTDQKSFSNHSTEVLPGDTLYFFTDGYQDQFGGDKGKKFKTSKLIQLLLSIRLKSMTDQKGLLNEAFESWRGNLEQVDDVCVIGIRI